MNLKFHRLSILLMCLMTSPYMNVANGAAEADDIEEFEESLTQNLKIIAFGESSANLRAIINEFDGLGRKEVIKKYSLQFMTELGEYALSDEAKEIYYQVGDLLGGDAKGPSIRDSLEGKLRNIKDEYGNLRPKPKPSKEKRKKTHRRKNHRKSVIANNELEGIEHKHDQ